MFPNLRTSIPGMFLNRVKQTQMENSMVVVLNALYSITIVILIDKYNVVHVLRYNIYESI